jgi:putative membrane-bound dehydrogenase-like protein
MTLALLLAASTHSATVSADDPKKSPITPTDAPRKMTLPEGFNVTLFAAEPDVVQPIAFTIDPRGRLWVAENYSYPVWLGGPRGRDRILIFEDIDGDGKHDKRTVFWDKGTNITGLILGFGGVWVCATPNLLFIPDKNGDDMPDGPPVVKLNGWDEKAQHNMFNALNWAPDGWLWGCNGILSNSRVGKPGTPDALRVAINCGVWRYHPRREVFEVVATGTTNPWGLDFDAHGEAFITNCVIPHLFRVTPGSHFQRMFGQDFNPHLYELMQSCADHIHWDTVQVWSDIRTLGVTSTTDRAGGGHAHVGAMIYLGDNWPAEYHNNVFTCNVHGHRINRDILERKGSGDVARHGEDFLLANDDWFRGLELKYGPDGAVYLTDWSDTGECHETDADNAHRENGRIYKIAFSKPAPVKVDLTRASDAELLNDLKHQNEWFARTARRLLIERCAESGVVSQEIATRLSALLSSKEPTPIRLRALWLQHALGLLGKKDAENVLFDQDERMRAWAVRLHVDREGNTGDPLPLVDLARRDPSPAVRLAVAAALQRLVLSDRWEVARALVNRAEDAQDQTIPLMLWYGIEPLVSIDRARAVELIASCEIPLVRRFLARRACLADEERAEGVAIGLEALSKRLTTARGASERRDILDGILDAFRGRKHVTAPKAWAETAPFLEALPDAEIRLRTVHLALLFGDPKAPETLLGIVSDKSAPVPVRERALQAVVEAKTPALAPRLQQLLDDPSLRGAVLRALATVTDAATPRAILTRYRELSPEERDDAIATLASRADFATALLDAIGVGAVPPRDLSVTIARQLQALNKPDINERLERVWGSSRPTAKDKVALMARYKSLLAPGTAKSDPSHGRLVFNRTCQQCHKLYDVGGDIGPNLTGSDRANLDYVLENILDPSATVARDYRLTTVVTDEGRVISGIIREQTDKTVTIQTINEQVVLPRDQIEAIKELPVSMMPEGLLERLSAEEFRDLVSYLASKRQVPAAESPRK